MVLKSMQGWAAVAALCGVLAVAAPAPAQEGAAMPPMGAPEQMKDVAFMVGTWACDVQMRMDPSAEWIPEKATVKIEPALDGCFLMSNFEGVMMGMPFKGVNILGYDRETKKWQSTWMDNMGARISYSEGGPKDDGSIVMEGDDFMMGQKMRVRQTTKNITDAKFDWSMEVSMDGGTTYAEMMKISYVKK